MHVHAADDNRATAELTAGVLIDEGRYAAVVEALVYETIEQDAGRTPEPFDGRFVVLVEED